MSKNPSSARILPLAEQLQSIEHQKLVEMLVSVYTEHPALQPQLEMMVAGLGSDLQPITHMIKNAFSSLKKAKRFIDYHESTAFAHHLDTLRLRIVQNVNATSPALAFKLLQEFLALHEKVLNRVDDSNGSIGHVFRVVCEDLGKTAHDLRSLAPSELEEEHLVDMVFQFFMNNHYGIYDQVIQHFQKALNQCGLDRLQYKFEQAAHPENTRKISLGLAAIADSKNDVDAFIYACSFAGKPTDHDHLEIAKRLIAHGQGNKALKWLEAIELPPTHSWQDERTALTIQALTIEGEHARAQTVRLSWFAATLRPKLYHEILANAQPSFKQAFQVEAIEKALDFHEPHTALHFLIAIEEFQQAAQFVRRRFHELSGSQYYTLRPAAEVLGPIDPLAATLLYRKMIEPILEATKTPYYRYAAKDLVMCGILKANITDWQALPSHDEYHQELEAKHKRKMRFWTEYAAALHKSSIKAAKLTKPLAKT